jgi:ferrochelatase
VRPFLLNLFTDPAILRVPFFIRPLLARRIAAMRVEPARASYAALGGGSPLLELTQAQAEALARELNDFEVRCFIAMRYWHPLSEATAKAVYAWRPDEVILLPLYPQYSTTTTGSSLTAWHAAATRVGLVADTIALCCYATDVDYVAATARLLQTACDAARAELAPATQMRVLFSAHGLPEKIVQRGDPYQWQIEQTVAHVVANCGDGLPEQVICYQSRATPQQWIGPSTEAEIERAAHDGVAVLVVPIAFVSDHSETLIELDEDYRALAERLGVPGYYRVPVQNTDAAFITALANIVRRVHARGPGLCSHAGGRVCPAGRSLCPLQ